MKLYVIYKGKIAKEQQTMKSEEWTQIDNKKHMFRVQIRRKQINEIFEEKRREFQQAHNQHVLNQLEEALSLPGKKQQFLLSIKEKLLNRPLEQWLLVVNSLYESVRLFKNSFKEWIETGLLSLLLDQFRSGHTCPEVCAACARVIGQMLYLGREDVNKDLLQMVQSDNVLDGIVRVCGEHQDVTDYFLLIQEMIEAKCELRDHLLNMGLGQIIIHRVGKPTQNTLENMDELEAGLTLSHRLVKIYQTKYRDRLPQASFSSIFMQIYFQYINLSLPLNILIHVLKGIAYILNHQRAAFFQDAFNNQLLLQIILNNLNVEQQPELRSQCLLLIGILTSCDLDEEISNLVRCGLFDKLAEIVAKERQSKKIEESILNIVYNIVNTKQEDCQNLINHRLFRQFLLPKTHESCPQNHRSSAYIILSSMISNVKKFNFYQRLIKDFSILEILVNGLNIKDSNVLKDIFSSFKHLMNFYHNVYSETRGNYVIETLERIYNLSEQLTKIYEEVNNKHLQLRIDELLQIINDS